MLSLTLILFEYLYTLVRGLILHWYISIFASLLAKDNRNLFVRYGRRRRTKCIPILNLYTRAFATVDDHREYSFLWDTYVIPFANDNSETSTMWSQRRLFTGPLIPTSGTLYTAEGLTTTIKLVGSIKLILTDDANNYHSYDVPCCVFDPKTPVNILDVPALGTLLGDNSDATDPFSEDGTTIKSGTTNQTSFWIMSVMIVIYTRLYPNDRTISLCWSWLFHIFLYQSA